MTSITAKGAYISGMGNNRPYGPIIEQLKAAGLRPTRQRLALAKLLFDQGNRHVTAEMLHSEASAAKVRVSLATVYNTLHQFTSAGLLREVVVEAGRSYFDTNVSEHHHFYFEDTCGLEDIPGDKIQVADIPAPPKGTRLSQVDVIVRVNLDKN